MEKLLICFLLLNTIPTLASSQEFGEKSIYTRVSVNDDLTIRMMCSAAKDDGLSSVAEMTATAVTSALPGIAQSIVLNGLKQAFIVSPGEGYCAVMATSGDGYLPSSAIAAGSIFTSAVRDGEITYTETDTLACRYLNSTGVCWEEVKSGGSELSGVVGCFEAMAADNRFSIVIGREDLLASINNKTIEVGLRDQSCAERGLGLIGRAE